jgi:hypothetical protein
MENTSPVPIKTKIAAWMLIGTGIYSAAAFLYGLFTAILQTTEFKSEVLPIAASLVFIALIVAFFSFLAGLPLFAKQKKRILLHASIVFLATFATLFALWRGIISVANAVFSSIGCNMKFAFDAPACVANGDAFSNSLNLLFYSTTGTIIIGFLVFVLVFSGLKIMKFNGNWRKAAIVLMAINVLTMGNIALSIHSFFYLPNELPVNDVYTAGILPISVGMLVSLGFSLVVIGLLVLDRKQFFDRKKAE